MNDRPDKSAWATDLVARVNRLPKAAVFLAVLALGLAAFFTPGVIGAVLVAALAALVAGRLALTWEQQPPPQRAAQILVLGVLVMIAASKVM